MIISTKELKEFLKLSKPIKQNRVLPILDYIKLEIKGDVGIFTKTNLHSYCLHQVEVASKEDCTILIDEGKLSALISNTIDDVINIQQRKNGIEISDTVSKITFSKENPDMYQKFPEGDGQMTALSPEMTEAIDVAKNYVMEMEIPNQFSFVFSVPRQHNTLIYGCESNGGLYVKRFDEILPLFSLNKEAATLVGSLNGCQYYTAGNYDLFTNGTTTYGFIKNDFTPLPVEKLFNRKGSDNRATLFKDHIISFCDTAISVSGGKVIPNVVINSCDSGMILECKQPGMDIDLVADIAVEHSECSGFKTNVEFGVRTLSRCLRALPYEYVTVRLQEEDNKAGFILSHPDDPGYFGLIMGLGFQ